MGKQTKEEPAEKEYGLKPIELNLIAGHQQRAQQGLFDLCAFIALERLAVNVDQLTTFRVENGKLFVGRLPEPPAEEKPKDEVSVA